VNKYIGYEHQPKGASVVYWIHTEEHTDMYSQGYVGITMYSAKDRWINHRSASRRTADKTCKILNSALRKYDSLIYEVILVADSREYCERIEALLRPTQGIGWNIARGGMPVDTMMGGIGNRYRWVQHWIDNPMQAAERWWQTERKLLNKQARIKRKLNKPAPHTKERPINSNNTSGYKGVGWFVKSNKWRAQIGIRPYVYTIGYYEDKEQARQHHCLAENIRTRWRKNLITKEQAITQIKSLQKRFSN
jgi:hypothetical protein